MLYRSKRRSTRPPSRGQALVEFILVLPLFLVLLMGLLDFGRVIWAHNAIRLDAEGAARFASVSANTRTDAQIRAEAKRISPAVPFPDSAINNNGALLFYPSGTDVGNPVMVQIVLEVPIVTPFVSQIVGGSVTVSVKSEELIH
jgi:Flp pilus assembly protein TadG